MYPARQVSYRRQERQVYPVSYRHRERQEYYRVRRELSDYRERQASYRRPECLERQASCRRERRESFRPFRDIRFQYRARRVRRVLYLPWDRRFRDSLFRCWETLVPELLDYRVHQELGSLGSPDLRGVRECRALRSSALWDSQAS